MRPFDYYTPKTLEEATAFLARHGDDAYPLAGGTDLVTKTRYGRLTPKTVVSLQAIPNLRDITPEHDGGLRIGAMVTVNQLVDSDQIREHYSLIAEAAGKMASPLIRNLATVGGNLCNAAPSADMAPALIALAAEAVIVGPDGERRLPLEEFFVGPGQTVLARGELLTAISLPPPDHGTRGVYLKHMHRQAMDIAIAGVAALIRLGSSPDGSSQSPPCAKARIVLGAVAPTPLRAYDAERVLESVPLTEETIAESARRAAGASRPIDDTYSSAWYRREMVEVLTRRALEQLTTRENV